MMDSGYTSLWPFLPPYFQRQSLNFCHQNRKSVRGQEFGRRKRGKTRERENKMKGGDGERVFIFSGYTRGSKHLGKRESFLALISYQKERIRFRKSHSRGCGDIFFHPCLYLEHVLKLGEQLVPQRIRSKYFCAMILVYFYFLGRFMLPCWTTFSNVYFGLILRAHTRDF